MIDIDVRPATPNRWPQLEAFFGPSGAYSSCWCTWWRQTGGEFSAGCADRGRGNRELLRAITLAGGVPGLLAYRGETPVGWVSVAPRPRFGRILRSPTLRPVDPGAVSDETVWSIACFWMPRRERGRGVGSALLEAAVRHAQDAGAHAVEGYPIDTDGQRRASPELFTGTLSMFRRAGFREVARRGHDRPVMRLEPVTPDRSRAGVRRR